MLPPVLALVYTDQEMIEILEDWKESLDQVSFPYDEGEMMKLESALFKLGRPKERFAEERSILYEKAQVKMLAEPNHAKYFQDKLEEARKKLPEGVRRHSASHNDFEALRCRIIRDTMSHIPSPEIVKALGDYLDDERDTPPPNNWLDTRSNAYLACSALQKIGLKNAPLPPTAGENPDNLATWKLWWGPIEAGNRTFSFEGQDVEYRFRKDGTYETLSRTGAQKRTANGAAGEIENTPTKLGKPVQRWLILLGGCAALFAWLRWQSKHKKT
jgi:hypothetical protein